MNLSQVNLFVIDFEAMLEFYRDKLGFSTNDIEPGPPCVPMVNWASLSSGFLTIELFDAATFWDQSLLEVANRQAIQLCFAVEDALIERGRLSAKGIELDPVVTEEWGQYASFRDPEGNWLQIFEVHDQSGASH
jgi:catechol 2,3-dioxygenase-like lactoylglutathione lyase family enzyme